LKLLWSLDGILQQPPTSPLSLPHLQQVMCGALSRFMVRFLLLNMKNAYWIEP
jgi:hypothetical protein